MSHFLNNADRNTVFYCAVGCTSFYFLIWPRISSKIEYLMLKDRKEGELYEAHRDLKAHLFGDLASLQPQENGETVILELGISSGANIEYFPSESTLIASDIHSIGLEEITKKCESAGVILRKYLKAQAEDLACIPSGSVSAVVTTLVTCSFQNPTKAFEEIHRVSCFIVNFCALTFDFFLNSLRFLC